MYTSSCSTCGHVNAVVTSEGAGFLEALEREYPKKEVTSGSWRGERQPRKETGVAMGGGQDLGHDAALDMDVDSVYSLTNGSGVRVLLLFLFLFFFILSILLYAAVNVYKIITLVKQKIKNIHRGRH